MSEGKWFYPDKLRKSLKEVDENLDNLFESIDGNVISEVSITLKTVLGDEVDVSYEVKTNNYNLQKYHKNFSEKTKKSPNKG